MPASPLTERGFTLIELAIVLVVIGLLIGLGTSLMGPLTKQAKVRESQEIVKGAKEAILGSVVKNGFLPMSTAGARSIDGWGSPLQYVRAAALEGSTTDACGVVATGLTVRECQNDACSAFVPLSNIGFIIYSKGADYNDAGTVVTAPTLYRVMTQGSQYSSYNYDDIVAYVSLDEIRSRRGCGQPLAIVSPVLLPDGEEDSVYFNALQATGGKPPYSWSVTFGALPTGTFLSAGGGISGTININNSAPNTGELTACSNSFTFTATVTDTAGGTQSQSETITVRPKPLTILTQTIPAAFEDASYLATFAATGGKAPYAPGWSIPAVPCPAGLTCSGNPITGSPSVGSAGTYTIIGTLNDGCSTQTKAFALTVSPTSGGGGGGSCAALSLSPASGTGATATMGSFFTNTIAVAGGQAPYSGCVPSTCNGLSLSCAAPNAVISGTPLAPGTCTFNVGWTDSCSTPSPQNISGTYPVTINSAPCSGIGLSGTLPNAQVCLPYTGSVSVVGGVANYSWTIAPSPIITGITDCNGQNGAGTACGIGGTPTNTGAFSFTATVSDSCGTPQTISQGFTLTVADSCSGGISVTNSTGTGYWYSLNGAGCVVWGNGAVTTTKILPSHTTMSIYNHSSCSVPKLVCTTPLAYCSLKGSDTSSDCGLQMNTACSIVGP